MLPLSVVVRGTVTRLAPLRGGAGPGVLINKHSTHTLEGLKTNDINSSHCPMTQK